MNKLELIKRLVEAEIETLPMGFEDDPMGFILKKYPGLNNVMEYMMTKEFREFVDAIFVVAPKPTTFKVLLHNGQYFFLQFMGDTYQATVLGKNYYLKSIGEKERCMLAIARLLRYGTPLKTKGPEGGETGTEGGAEAGGLGGETTPTETGGEEAGGEEAGGEALEESKLFVKSLLENFIILKESPEKEILAMFKDDANAKSFKPSRVEKLSGENRYAVYFDGINTRDRATRKDVLRNLKPKKKVNVKYNKPSNWAKSGYITISKGDTTYNVTAKGYSETATTTNVKEGLVILFYKSKVKDTVTEDNFEDVVDQLTALLDSVTGIDDSTRQELSDYLQSVTANKDTIATLNQPLSQARTIKEAYKGAKVTRTGIFNEYRTLASQRSGMPADKWCPGDVYIILDEKKAKSILSEASKIEADSPTSVIQMINQAFNEEWGNTDRPITAVSLKFEKAQGGKAKAYFEKFQKLKTEYNLTDEEINYKEIQYREGIDRLRRKIKRSVSSNENIKYEITDKSAKIAKDKLKGKYAALKAINFLFSQISDTDQYDESLLALAAFAMSLGDVSPAFFKVKASAKGEVGEVESYKSGTNLSLYLNDQGSFEPIVIEDSSTYAGLRIKMKISKGEEKEYVQISARDNGNVQGTIEIERITPIK